MLKLVHWIRSHAGSGALKYLLSLTEQGFVSTLNLASNLLLIRNVGPAEYGVFVLTTNAMLILTNLQGAMTIAHLMTLPPGSPDRPERFASERMILAVTLLMVVVSALGAAAVVTVFNRETAVIPKALTLYLPALVLYSYTRSLAFSRGLVMIGTAQSGAVLLGSVVLLGLGYTAGYSLDVDGALLILALAYGASSVVTLMKLCGGMIGKLSRHDLLHFRGYARDSLWVLVGIGSIEVLTRFNSVIVSVWFDTAATGTLGATQLLLRPIGMAVSAWSLIGRVAMVERREAQDAPGFVRTVMWSMGGALAISAPWVAAVYFFWPFLSAQLFHGQYADDAWIVLLSGISTIVGVVLFVLSLGFQSLRRFQTLAYTDLAGVVVSIGATMLLLKLGFGFAMTIVGMTSGQVMDLVLLGGLLVRLLPRRRALGQAL